MAHRKTGLVEIGFDGGGGAEALRELQAFGVATFADLVALVPPDFETKHPSSFEEQTTFVGILRDAMIAQNARLYFERAFTKTWNVLDSATIDLVAAQGIGVEELRSKYGFLTEVDLDDEGDDLDDEGDDHDVFPCTFCGRRARLEDLQAVGPRGQEAALMCETCVKENDAESREW